MASALGRLARLAALRTPHRGPGRTGTPGRTVVTTSSGGILPKPKKVSFGLIRIGLVVVPFLYVGTQISKSFAALLEEHDIFVPEDDDDDD
ncbi:essential MCU regulator, mitochondrial-like [Notolabrus celidotus]|uniref:essential MCU regulator, mitochondrial-like n=1 Tax=Notolabrus celidotus TaxID=1203425 RepID=UPI00148F6C57|nr:essential MCU regulator, mitochondrial-like [Notolabrus celidotus]